MKHSDQADVGRPLPRVALYAGLEDGRLVAEHIESRSDVTLAAVFSLDDTLAIKQSGYVTLDGVAAPGRHHKFTNIEDTVPTLQDAAPDLVLIVGMSVIIPESVLQVPSKGTVGFHTAILPGRRGCSPVIWAIVDGMTSSGVTMFYMDKAIDAGDIIDTKAFDIAPDEDANDVLKKANQATVDLVETRLHELCAGTAPRTPHDLSLSTYTRKRSKSDGEIDWNEPAEKVVNLVRALAPPYPGAHFFAGDGQAVIVEKARLATAQELPLPRTNLIARRQHTVVCVVAHPDDEVLGVGGTLALHALRGDRVVVLILSEGEDEKSEERDKNPQRLSCAEQAAIKLGVSDLVFLDIPDQKFDQVPFIDLIHGIEGVVKTERPTIIYTHHPGDANTDHQLTFKATYAACRPMTAHGLSIESLLTFETPSSTDQAPQLQEFVFNPQHFVGIDETWNAKVEALHCYASEIVGGIHPRSYDYIRSLARMRGGHSGFMLAEAFGIARQRTTLL